MAHASSIRERNRNDIYRLLYQRDGASKQQLADELGLSLPTVTHNLATLTEAGLISKDGTFSSTGGRPATVYRCVPAARHALGVEVTAGHVRMAAIDLSGSIMARRDTRLSFSADVAYLDKLGELARGFYEELDLNKAELLGTTVSIQAIVSPDGEEVAFSTLLGDAHVRRNDFAERLPGPVFLVHDAEAAGYAELWHRPDLRNVLYLSLNQRLGSAMVMDGRLTQASGLGAGVAEHLTLVPGGAPCYCGNRGCADTVLGARVLAESCGRSPEELFKRAAAGEDAATQVLERYLEALAELIYDVRMVTGCDVVLGGELSRLLRDEDIARVRSLVRGHGTLGRVGFRLLKGHYGAEAAVVGAGLLRVSSWLEGFGVIR